jgi:hypothetical protein
VIEELLKPLTKNECKHPYFRVPFKSIPQQNVNSDNHDGRSPIHLVVAKPFNDESLKCLRALVINGRGDIDRVVSIFKRLKRNE